MSDQELVLYKLRGLVEKQQFKKEKEENMWKERKKEKRKTDEQEPNHETYTKHFLIVCNTFNVVLMY